MKYLFIIMLNYIALSSQAGVITLATDNASNYENAWQGNGGFGFSPWYFLSDPALGSAGRFLANSMTDVNAISTDNKAWGSYANGSGFNQFEAYRGFGNNSLQQGDSLEVSIEHGNINYGGSAGFVLRNQNIHNNIGDYNQAMRFEFGFIGGGQNYSIFDGYGVTDTGIAFTDAGLKLTFTLLSVDLYQLDIFSAIDETLLQTRNGILNGSGAIESIALYNRDTELANVYFNSLSISRTVTSVNEPSTIFIFVLALVLFFVRQQKGYKKLLQS